MSEFGADVIVPLAGIFCLFGLPVLAFVMFRLLAHRERMEMIRNGLTPGTPAAREWKAAATPQPVRPIAPDAALSADSAHVTLRKGITLTFIGFAITLGLSFIGFHDDGWRPGPWLLGGLVPMFVGLAQIIIALLSGASLGLPRQAQQPYYGAPPPQPPPAGAAPTFDSSYTYRPGSTQELRPPASPPERRS